MLDLKDHLKANILDPSLGPYGVVSWYELIKGSLTTFLPIGNLTIPIDEDDFVIRLLASMAPILGKSEFGDISDACSDASWTYLINMFAYQQMWALQSKYLAGVSSLRVPEQLTLSQPGEGGRLCPPNNTGTPGFSNLPTSLLSMY